MKKELTIVTTSLRSENFLPGYLQNILEMTDVSALQFLLICNDPSPHEKQLSTEFAKEYPHLFSVQYTSKETIGASLNRGWAQATTPYLAYADIDDRRTPDAFARQLATLKKNPDISFTYGDFLVVDTPEKRSGKYIHVPEFDSLEFTRGSYVGPGHCFRKELLDQLGGFDEQLLSGADFDFQVRAAFVVKFKKTPGLLTYYLQDPAIPSASRTKRQAIEASLITLRYGAYDKVDYRYLDHLTDYSLLQIFFRGKSISIDQQIPNYQDMLTQRRLLWKIPTKYRPFRALIDALQQKHFIKNSKILHQIKKSIRLLRTKACTQRKAAI